MSKEAFITSYVLDDDILVIRLHGDLDAFTTDEFNAQVKKHLEDGHAKIIIDCAHLGYVSSVGIGALVALQKRLRDRGGRVKLAAIQGTVAEVLKILHLGKVLDIHGDIEFARQSFDEE